MGYIISLFIGGCIGLLGACLIAANKDEHDRQELIEKIRTEIYEEIYSSKE